MGRSIVIERNGTPDRTAVGNAVAEIFAGSFVGYFVYAFCLGVPFLLGSLLAAGLSLGTGFDILFYSGVSVLGIGLCAAVGVFTGKWRSVSQNFLIGVMAVPALIGLQVGFRDLEGAVLLMVFVLFASSLAFGLGHRWGLLHPARAFAESMKRGPRHAAEQAHPADAHEVD